MKCTNSYVKSVGLLFLLCVLCINSYAQDITVKGIVNDAFGPIVGASVVQKGTTNGIVTDLNGNFTLSVPSNSTITVSFIGYKSQDIPVNGQRQITVTLKEDTEMLDEVVVVGYGQMKRSDLTGSVVSVNDQAIKKSVPTSIDQVLQGRAAGVQIQANTGTPGGSSSIRIRGINSLNATNQPIFVIDGVIVDSSTSDDGNSNPLSSINPSDIVSMDVLKDASATAIYGARASNGVIMITTKRGKAGEGSITYDGYVGWQSMPGKLDVLNLREYAAHKNVMAEADFIKPDNNFLRPDLLGEGTDWQDELYRNALMTSHNISMTGGSEKITYAISAGYLDQEGIALGSSFKRLSLRGNIEAEIKSWLKGGLNFSLADSKQKVGTENNIIMNALTSAPSVSVYNAEGGFDGPEDVWQPDNPVALATIKDNHNKKENFRFSTYLEATILKGLSFKTELSTDYNLNKFYFYEPDWKFGAKENNIRTSKWTKTDTKYWSWRNVLTYNHTFADKHTINVMLGQEMSESHWETQVSNATGFLSNSATDPSAGDISKSSGTGLQNNSSIFSYFGRAIYSFDDRYLLTATIRRDGSSKFAKNNRWGWFPSAALAWKISNESFLKDHPVINNLKFRFGWGTTGNQNVSDWAYIALLSTRTTPWGTGVLNGNTANPSLKWETTYSTNIGVDLNLFDNRIEFIADIYYKKTKDLLLQIGLPSFLGSAGYGAASNPWGNIGSLENKGIELTLNTVNFDNGKFSWRSNFVFSMNRNKVRSLDTETGALPYTLQIGDDTHTITNTVEGHPIGQFWGFKVIGRFNEPTDFYYKDANGIVKEVPRPEGSGIAKGETWLGDYIFEDVNKDGVISAADQTFIGNPEPKFTYGIGNTFSWKGLDLTIFLSGSYGNDVVNYNRRWLEQSGGNGNILKDATNVAIVEKIDPNGPDDFRNYHVTGGDPNAPRLYKDSDKHKNWRMSDRYVEDGSYLRIQNISLGYTFPKKWLQKTPIQNLKIYANLQNVYTWSKYKGYDPEVGCLWGNNLMNGVDYGRYPSPRIYTFGLNVSF